MLRRRSIRSDLWNPVNHVDRDELPSGGEILRAVSDHWLSTPEQYDRERSERYARGDSLY